MCSTLQEWQLVCLRRILTARGGSTQISWACCRSSHGRVDCAMHAAPEALRGPAMAHVERPALECALLAAAERVCGLRIHLASDLAAVDPGARTMPRPP